MTDQEEAITSSSLELYRICWKSESFTMTSCGPILRHSDRGRLKNGNPYTRQEALLTCLRLNQQGKRRRTLSKNCKQPYIKHWVEDVRKDERI